MNSYLVDDIDHVFDAYGNKHFVFSAASGACHPDGTDIAEPKVTLVVPASRLHHLAALLQQVVDTEADSPVLADTSPPPLERLGGAIFSDAGV